LKSVSFPPLFYAWKFETCNLHTCAMDEIREGSGLAIRFPRFTGNYRFDKAAEDATTEKEIIEMYRSQLKKLSEG